MRDQRIRIGAALLLAGIFMVAEARSRAANPKADPKEPECSTCVLARPASLPGVENFAAVTSELYRGAQPSARGFEELKKLGIAIDVDLRAGRGQNEYEKRTVEALGMRYVLIPWSSIHRPQDEQVAAFLELLAANPGKKIFVHCREGRDRTGVMIAAFRIANQRWPAPAAAREMQAFHFHSFWFHSWKTYVLKFPQEYSSGAAFGPVRVAATAPHL